MVEKEPNTNPTDTLVEAMEDADNIDVILIIYTGKDGSMYYKSNTQSLTERIGMTEMMKQRFMNSAFGFDDEGECDCGNCGDDERE